MIFTFKEYSEINGKCDTYNDKNYYVNNDVYCYYKCLINIWNSDLSNCYIKY